MGEVAAFIRGLAPVAAVDGAIWASCCWLCISKGIFVDSALFLIRPSVAFVCRLVKDFLRSSFLVPVRLTKEAVFEGVPPPIYCCCCWKDEDACDCDGCKIIILRLAGFGLVRCKLSR